MISLMAASMPQQCIPHGNIAPYYLIQRSTYVDGGRVHLKEGGALQHCSYNVICQGIFIPFYMIETKVFKFLGFCLYLGQNPVERCIMGDATIYDHPQNSHGVSKYNETPK